jgi:hypothetical protein
MKIGKYSFGTGDRFAHQGKAQLRASIKAKAAGIDITHVWNKSFREHKTVGSSPADVRREADEAVKALAWEGPYLVDADHINMNNVDGFIPHSDFFTIDVAEHIGQRAKGEEIDAFVKKYGSYTGALTIPGISEPFEIKRATLQDIAENFLLACREAGTIYRHIAKVKGNMDFIAEVSMDEVEDPQTPGTLFFILAMLADAGVPAQTIAPKFTGRFNKGVDYVGNVDQFAREFEDDILVIRHAVKTFNLPENLKLSVHSGSDKFSIYEPINKLVKLHGAGVHVKTAGTTWLEELIGLAMGGGEGLALAKEIYASSLQRFDELTAPYSTVIDVQKENLPSIEEVIGWSGEQFTDALRHDPANPGFNKQFRQLLHCGYKVAADLGDTFTRALDKYEEIISAQVTDNLFERHIRPLFLD